MRRVAIVLAFASSLGVAVCTALPAQAEPATDAQARELRYDLRLDLPITLSGAALWLGSELAKSSLAPARCRWCEPPGVDVAVRNALVWSDTKTPDVTSNILGFAVIPVGLLGLDALAAHGEGRLANWPVDALVIAEAAVLAGELNQAVKFVVGRERPFVHALPADQKLSTPHPDDNNLSFFSAHTSVTFALAVSAGTVASMRRYAWAPAIWAIGPALALTTAYLRIAADKHYFTDVVTGAVVGSAIGFVVPYVFHRPRESRESPSVSGGPLGSTGMSMSWIW